MISVSLILVLTAALILVAGITLVLRNMANAPVGVEDEFGFREINVDALESAIAAARTPVSSPNFALARKSSEFAI